MENRGKGSINMQTIGLYMITPLNILIYSGDGTCEYSVSQTYKILKRFLKPSYDIKLVDLDTLRNDRIPWDESCVLFVMPGGRDLKYLESFKGTGIIERLRDAIGSGRMKYLGICAGAYFAADRIEFLLGSSDENEIVGDRPLKLIDTLACGPLVPFKYGNRTVTALEISTIENVKLKVAYNGGCCFPEAKEDLIFARYSLNNNNLVNCPNISASEAAILLSRNNFCLSGVHFEYEASDCGNDELLPFEKKRIELIRTILKGLGLQLADTEFTDDGVEVIYLMDSNGYMEDLNEFIKNKSIKIVKSTGTALLPEKFLHLHSNICTSTQTILLNEPALLSRLPNFTIYSADHQTKGRGRVNNIWISSKACLQFTLKIDWDLKRGARLPLLQFLMALTLAESINSFRFKDSEVKAKIKWPNDIYLVKQGDLIGKVSGILVNCLQSSKAYNVLIGVGVNLLCDDLLPNIIHLNDHFETEISKDEFLLDLLERFKLKYEEFSNSDSFPFDDYHQNWLHSSQQIQIQTDSSKFQKIRIKGIDEFGYLVGKSEETGRICRVEPDGNSFDMMQNLIKRKE